MAFKTAFVCMAPEGDPKTHRATIYTPKMVLTTVVVELMNFDLAVQVCKDLVQNEGVQSIILCPGFHHEAVARVVSAVGPSVAIEVVRGDVPSGRITAEILAREGWFPEEH